MFILVILTFICACSKTPSEKAEDLIMEERLLWDGTQYKDTNRAMECLNNSILLKPSNLGYYRRGHLYNYLGQYEKAIEDYTQAIRIKPDYADAYFLRGNAYYNLHQYGKAIEDYSQAIRIQPDAAIAYEMRGSCYLKLVQISLGCINLQKACQFDNCQSLEQAKLKGICL